jgi:hypothetical protein
MPRGMRKGATSKRAFVLSLPADMPAKEVVERAAAAGMKLKETYIYVVRSNARQRKVTPSKRRAARGSTGSAETEFRRLAIELGLGKSKELLEQTERKVAELIAGS